MIKEYIETINNKIVKFKCNEILKSFIESFIKLLEEEDNQYGIIKDDYTIEAGWSMYFINKENENYRISVPDYNKNPFIDKTDDLTIALTIQKMQNELLKDINQKGCPVTFQDKIVVLKEALYNKEVYMHRSREREGTDSGWYLGIVNDQKEKHPVSDYTSIYTFELLKHNPVLLRVLSADVGDIVIVYENEIVEIVNGNDEKIY